MKVSYEGLQFLLDSYGMTRSDLVEEAGLTFNVIVAIGKGETISSAAILKICRYFICDISDIMHLVFDEAEMTEAKISAFRSQLKARGRDDIEIVVDNEHGTIIFFYVGTSNKREMLLSLSLDSVPTQYSRREMFEAVEPLVTYVCQAANRKSNPDLDLKNNTYTFM